MGGKTLKFPSRAKYRAPDIKMAEEERKPVSEEEHKKILDSLSFLKSLGGKKTEESSNSSEKKE